MKKQIIINGSVLADPLKIGESSCGVKVTGYSGQIHKNGYSSVIETEYSILIHKPQAQAILNNVRKGFCAKIILSDKSQIMDNHIKNGDIEFWQDEKELHA